MTLAQRVVSAFDRARWVLLLLSLPLLVWSAWMAADVGVDNALDVWFVDDDPALEAYHDFQDRFGNDEVVALAVHDDHDVLTVDGFRRIDAVARAAESVPGIAEVVAVTNLVHVRTDDAWVPEPGSGEAPPMVVGSLMDDLPASPAQALLLRQRAMSDPSVAGTLISRDGTTALVVARMASVDDLDAVRDGVLEQLRVAVDAAAGAHVPRAGMGVVFSALNVASSRDVGVIGGFSYALIAVLLGLLFRRPGPVLLTLAIVVASVLTTFGVFGLVGRDLNMVTMAIPTLILIIGIADAVHMLHRIAEQPEGDAGVRARAGVSDVLWPCLFASLTTAAGFLALALAKMQVVRDLGLFAAVGVLAAFFFTVLFVLIGGRVRALQPKEQSLGWLARIIAAASGAAVRRSGAVIVGSGVAALVGAYGLSLLMVDTYSIDYFYKANPVRQDSAHIEQAFGPYTPLELVVRGDDLRTVDALGAIAAWQDRMEAQPDVGWSRSVADVARRLNQVLSDGEVTSFRVPEDDLQLEQALFLYESDPDADVSDLVDDDWTEARVTVGIPMTSAKGFAAIIDRLSGLSEFPDGMTVTASGYIPLYVTMMDYIVVSQVSSFAAAFIVIFALLALLFRSARMALLAMPANLLPLFLTLGVMGMLGIRLDVATVTIAALVLGLVVDDTTHFLFRFRQHLREGHTHEDAVRLSMKSTGVAMASTTLVLVVGFSVLGLATVKSVAYFGVLSSVAMSAALVADVALMPALLVRLRPRL